MLATGDDSFDELPNGAEEPAARAERHRQLEGRAAGLVEWLDPRSDAFQSSTGEALFMTNHPALQQLGKSDGRNLTARLAQTVDNAQLGELASWAVFSRRPVAEELSICGDWVLRHKADRATACRDLVWALVTSAEFRFNH